MAQQPAPASRQPVSSHYLAQSGLTVALAAAIGRVWPQVDVLHLSATLPGFRDDVQALVRQFSLASATLAARDYARARQAAGIRSSFTVRPAAPPPVEQIDKALNFATQGLYDGTLLEPTATQADIQQAADTALVQVEGVTSRLVLNTGRETTVTAVQEDRQARAWARETRPNACYFCAMLATRGAVYKSEHTAGRTANEKFIGEGEFKYHNHCRCVAVPVFGQYEKTAEARAWTRQWYDLKRELGNSPSLLQWRRHFEGRDVGTGQSPPKEPTDSPQPRG